MTSQDLGIGSWACLCSGHTWDAGITGSRSNGSSKCTEIRGWLLESIYIENLRFALDTLRMANRSPTPTSKTNDFLGPFDDIWGGRGRWSLPIWGVPGVWGGNTNICIYIHIVGWGSESFMDPPNREVVFRVRVVRDVHAKLCAM